MILTIRTDKPEAELGLFDGDKKIAYYKWQAHRLLAETLHIKIKELLDSEKKNLSNLSGILVYSGPGSFTGLRIGVSVGNALSYGLNIPIYGANGDDWLKGLKKLLAGNNDKQVHIKYGAPVKTTPPKN